MQPKSLYIVREGLTALLIISASDFASFIDAGEPERACAAPILDATREARIVERSPTKDAGNVQSVLRPKAIRLRGQSESKRGDRTSGTQQFEILLEGPDQYYRREWRGEKGKGDWYTYEQIILPDFESQGGEAFTFPYGTRGGYNSSYVNHRLMPAVARRIWPEAGRIGVGEDQLLYKGERYSEEFHDLKATEGIPFPNRIVWRDYDLNVPGLVTTYTIEDVELLSESQKPLFESVRNRIAPGK